MITYSEFLEQINIIPESEFNDVIESLPDCDINDVDNLVAIIKSWESS